MNPEDFTRKRTLPFDYLIYFFAGIPTAAYETELRRFNKDITGSIIAKQHATKGALSRARHKIKYEAYIELNTVLNKQYEKEFDPLTWKGFRLLAIDGTLITVPDIEEIVSFFGVWDGRQGDPCPKARASQLYDVLNSITIDARLAPKNEGERELAAYHCLNLQKNDLILLDRGYEGFWLVNLIRAMDADFCARVSSGKLSIVKEFVASGKMDDTVVFSASHGSASMQQCSLIGIGHEPMKVRMIRVDLPSGETEVLITSLLDKETYPTEVFADLYHQRWPVEEDYKIMKSRLQVENFTGKALLSVQQDFYAKIFSKNLTSLFIQSTQAAVEDTNKRRQKTYKVNFTNALSVIKQHVVALFIRCTDILDEVVWQIQGLIARALNQVRKDHSSKRNFKKSSRRKYHLAYKPVS